MNFILYNGPASRHRGTGRERQGGIKGGREGQMEGESTVWERGRLLHKGAKLHLSPPISRVDPTVRMYM